MDEAYREVRTLMGRLKKFEDNFKKCSKANRTKGYLKGRLVGITELWKSLCEADGSMESLKDEENGNHAYFKDDEYGLLEARYYQVKGDIEDQLEALEPQRQPKAGQGSNNHHDGRQQSNESRVKLPKISLPTFYGSYHTWMSFKNRFTNLIHDNKALSKAEKLEYLKSCVKGNAERAIERYQITDQNYQAAWDRLNDKYNNKRILQDTQIETIIDRMEIKSETAKEIRDLLDVIQESLESLKNLDVDTTSWDPMLVVLVKRKLPFKTLEEWEKMLETDAVPTFKQLMDFLEKRYRTVESLELVGGTASETSSSNRPVDSHKDKQNQSSNHRTHCSACNDKFHSLMICETFLNMTTSSRSAFVNAKRLCRNCLATGHMIRDCKSSKKCFKCNKAHHTLLHRDDVNYNTSLEPNYSSQNFVTRNQLTQNYNSQTRNNPFNTRNPSSMYNSRNPHDVNNANEPQRSNGPPQNQPANTGNSQDRRNFTTIAEVQSANDRKVSKRETLFPTAIIKFKSEAGVVYNLRALLDQCSEDVFIKGSVAKMLGTKQVQIPSFDVTGLGGAVTSRIEKATKVKMVIEDETLDMDANVVTSLVGILPQTTVEWPKDLFKNLKLADTNFATPNNIDIMLGTKAYTEILLDGVLKHGGYLAQNTKVGWIISGKADDSVVVEPTKKRMFLCVHTETKKEPDDILKKFWEMEEAPRKKKKFTAEESQCEKVFHESYRRLSDGRPQVRLPFKENPSENLGESRNQAVARWLAMERKLDKDENLKRDYMKSIQEHLELGHMERINTTEKEHKIIHQDGTVTYSCYYIPHHAVVKEESKTTKTRIVFDASAKSKSGKSLNDILMIGPTIQESLLIRLIKWRIHRFVLRGDVTKMYRQIKVYQEDMNFQRMVFRFERTDPIEDFVLNTLTFGTASAPYMAIRTLQQIAVDGETKFPLGSTKAKEDFHVDDLLTGADTVETVNKIWEEIRTMLMEAKFPMRKWSSNSNKVLQQIPEEEREFQATEITIEDTLKTLGIGWSPIEDYFFFKSPEIDTPGMLTKRKFLSQAAKLFDPLGWLGPVVLKPKIMFQRIWKMELKWDNEIPIELAQEWLQFQSELSIVEQIKIPRWFGWCKDYVVELHGFSDASEAAYGAVIYIKTTNEIGNTKIELVVAKSRVAPVQTVRLPRLELCGAVLLANLMDTVKYDLKVNTIYYWTDSSITLNWINSTPDNHKTFVANRITDIQECTQPQQWRHVDGTQNPADCLSRGLNPNELLSHELWWSGPQWLRMSKENWPKNPNVKIPEDQFELKGKKSLVSRSNPANEVVEKLLNRYTSFRLLVRVVARIRTVKNRMKRRFLSENELEDERMLWIRWEQNKAFSDEINSLKNNKPISSKSKLLQFYPFLDSNGVLRVGGRLQEAVMEYDSKHQIIIPKTSRLSLMIINDAHESTKHGGTQLTMTYTRNQYWIIDTRKSVRNQIFKCVKCHRYSQKMQTQLMGNLPEPRVNLTRSFLHSGLDYAGPVQVLTRRKPGRREVTKGWVALFVCLCTKAIHLELVSSLTSKSFRAAFTRFYGRRGLPSDMYSDNSLTFVGAKNELDEDLKYIKEILEPELADLELKNNVRWHFIPPHAPHWGGLWEAGVKSMKHHVRRVVGESVHTFEEITTMLVEIEAVLNSRPLCPLSSDTNDLSVLTPGHFLIGGPLLSPPRPSLLEVRPNRLGIFKQISQRVEHFAKRWKREYLTTLQHRPKWMRQNKNVEKGDLVLIKDDNYPPGQWKMGRVLEVYPDKDGLVRSARIRTQTSEIMRPIHKLSILPIDKPAREASDQ